MISTALIGLGSNLNQPIQQLNTAIQSLSEQPDIQVKRCSSYYQSLPQGPQDQDLFVNAVIAIETTLSPNSLLARLQAIEIQQGKVKVRHWGERCIDLDILFIDQITLNEPKLIIPHPHALTRDFVVIPSLEIEPEWRLPNGDKLHLYLDSCAKHDLRILP